MAWQTIPLDAYPDQNIHVTVEVGGQNIPLILRIRYNEEGGYWRMGISDGSNGHAILDGIPFVTGEYPAGDLLGQYSHLGLGSAYIVATTDPALPGRPNAQNLGAEYVLVWGDES